MAKILITGGTGLIGKRLQELLMPLGHEIHILTRNKSGFENGIHYWKWDVDAKTMDEKAVEVDHIIHLAGAGVMDEKWSDTRKKEIIDSRVESANLLYNALRKKNVVLKSFVGASAVGFYGDQKAKLIDEKSPLGKDFLAEVCQKWEQVSNVLRKENRFPVATVRIGIVLSSKGGALPQLDMPVKFGVGAYLGNGQQYYPWIHIDDVCNLILYALFTPLNDIYNAVAPHPVTNKDLVKTIAKVKNRLFIPAPAPKFVLNLMMGEMAAVLLNSQNVSSKKIETAGFTFQFPELEIALKDIYKRKV
jgi:uncharacterized protein (TIGR01777 family)